MSKRIVFDAVAKRRAARLAALADARSARLLQVTAPVYWFDDRQRPEAIGSAVLLSFSSWRFLLTAAHVLRLRHTRTLYVPSGASIIPIAGELTTIFDARAPSEAHDSADVTVVRLAGDAWAESPLAAFAKWEELDLDPANSFRHVFGLLGYPSTKQRNSVKGSRVEAAAYRTLATGASAQLYRKLGRRPDTNLVLGFDKRRMWGPEGMLTAPDLHGMSGSGIWRFGPNLHAVTQAPRLSGVLIEWHRRGPNKHVLGTRLGPILAALGARYSEVAEWLREAPIRAT